MPMRRVSPTYLIVIILDFIRDNLFALLGYVATKNSGHDWLARAALVFAILSVILLIFKFLNFFFFYRWQITADKIKRISGVINKTQAAYNLADVKSVLVTQSLFERVLQLYTVQIDFPQVGDDDQFKIVGLKQQQAEELQQFLKSNRQENEHQSEDGNQPLVKAYGLTPLLIAQSVVINPPIAAMSSLVLGLSGLLTDFGFAENSDQLSAQPLDILLYVLLAAIIFIGIRVFQYGNFKVARHAKRLEISNGVLAVQTNTLPIVHIQSLVIQQNILARALGYASVSVALLGNSQNQENAGVQKVMPFVKVRDLPSVAEQLLPEFTLPNLDGQFNYWSVLWLPVIIGGGILSWLISPWYLVPTVILLGVLVFFNQVIATISHQTVHQGWFIQHHYLYDETLVEWVNAHDLTPFHYRYQYLGYRLNKIKRLWFVTRNM